MQFIVPPSRKDYVLMITKWIRIHGYSLLNCIAFILVFTSGFVLGLLWNLDSSNGNKPVPTNHVELIQPEPDPLKQSVDMFILILSSPVNIDKRQTIRETWVRLIKEKSIRYKFVIGTFELEEEKIEYIEKENAMYKDILLLSNIKDEYKSLSRKLLNAFVHISNNYNLSYLAKVDDDSFVNIDHLYEELFHHEKPKSKLYWGYFDGNSPIQRSGKWKDTTWFLCDKYIPYALGGGYVLTSDLVEYIANNSALLQLYLNEDVSVGVWLAALSIKRVHDPRFDTEFVSRGCLNLYLISHKQSLEDLKHKYNNLTQFGKMCEKENLVKSFYNYNWKVPPSQCCRRKFNKIQKDGG